MMRDVQLKLCLTQLIKQSSKKMKKNITLCGSLISDVWCEMDDMIALSQLQDHFSK